MHDRPVRLPLPGEADRFAAAKSRADHLPCANFLRHAVQSQRSLLRILHLSDAVGRSRNAVASPKLIALNCAATIQLKERHPLLPHTDRKTEARRLCADSP